MHLFPINIFQMKHIHDRWSSYDELSDDEEWSKKKANKKKSKEVATSEYEKKSNKSITFH